MFRPSDIAANVDIVIIPNPPIWIRNNITSWPKIEKSTAVSRTISPVTHVPLVAVNKASTNLRECPSGVMSGNVNKTVPITMTLAKLITSSCAGRLKKYRLSMPAYGVFI